MSLTLSKRTVSISPSVTLAIDTRAKELRAAGLDVIGFGAGEPDFGTPDYIGDAAKYAIDHGMTRYTPVGGTIDLRKEICKKFERDNGLHYEPTQIVVSNGAKQSLFNALSAILNPGDEVLIPSPCWVSYPEMVRMAGGEPVLVKGDESNGFIVDAETLRPYVNEYTKALILNSPNNPNGNVCSREVLQGIADLAVEMGFYVISDEIYEKLIYDGEKHVSIASLNEKIQAQTIVVNGVSKSYAMTGWRIGYAAGPLNVIRAMTSYQSHASSNANSIAQYAAQIALTDGQEYLHNMVETFSRRRLLMHERLNAIPGLSAQLPKGAFYMMMNLSGVIGKYYGDAEITGSNTFAALLLDNKQVAVVPALAFGDDRYVRLSYATSTQNIEMGMVRIAEFVASLTDEPTVQEG